MKNIKIFVLSLIIGLSFGIVGNAFAQIYTSLPSPQIFGVGVQVSCSNIDYDVMFANENGEIIGGVICDGGFPLDHIYSDIQTAGTYTLIECNHSVGDFCNDETLELMMDNIDYISQTTFTFTEAVEDNPYGGIFFRPSGTDSENDLGSANELLASAGLAVNDTTNGLLPILAVVLGVILAFIGIKYIITLYNEADEYKKNKKR